MLTDLVRCTVLAEDLRQVRPHESTPSQYSCAHLMLSLTGTLQQLVEFEPRDEQELTGLVCYCRTTSASTAPCTPRRTCCPYAYVLVTVLRVSRSCELFQEGFDLHLLQQEPNPLHFWPQLLHRATGGEREFFIDNLLVRIHYVIVMIKWTGLAPWEFELPSTGGGADGHFGCAVGGGAGGRGGE